MIAIVTGNIIGQTGAFASPTVIFTPVTPTAIIDGKFVYRSTQIPSVNAAGFFSLPLVWGVYRMKIGDDVWLIQVPNTNLTYDAFSLVELASVPGINPGYALPISGSNFRVKADGTLQDFCPDTGLYHTRWLSSVGGLHPIWGVGEA
jgi:hypothetical protein